MDRLIKTAVKKDSTAFIEVAKEMLSDKYNDSHKKITQDITKSIVEGETDPLKSRGISGFKPGDDYTSAGTSALVANSDDIANAIVDKLKAKNITFAKSGLNITF